MRRAGKVLLYLGGATMIALYPLVAGEGSREAVNNKPAWIGWAVMADLVCLGIGAVFLIRTRAHEKSS